MFSKLFSHKTLDLDAHTLVHGTSRCMYSVNQIIYVYCLDEKGKFVIINHSYRSINGVLILIF